MQRRYRLGSSSLIRRVYAEGRRVRGRALVLTALVAPDGDPRVAVVASRKVGSAVVRNRARRRLRAAAMPLVPRLRPGAMVILTATEQTPTVSFQNLSEELAASARKAGLVAA